MIRISDEAKRLLSTLWSPDGDELRLVLRSPEADGARELTLGHGRGEGADQIVQHAGRQVLRIDRSVRRGFDGSSVEVVHGTLGVVQPGRDPQTSTPAFPFRGDRSEARTVRRKDGQATGGRGGAT